MATRRFRGEVEVLESTGEVAASAHCELVVDALGLGLDEWEGVLRDVSPPGSLTEKGRYRLRLPGPKVGRPDGPAEAEIVVNRTFSRGEGQAASVYQFLGSGPPPLLEE
jgi:hypothetical protein